MAGGARPGDGRTCEPEKDDHKREDRQVSEDEDRLTELLIVMDAGGGRKTGRQRQGAPSMAS